MAERKDGEKNNKKDKTKYRISRKESEKEKLGYLMLQIAMWSEMY